MLPYEQPSIFDQLPVMFSVPRVVLNQRAKFESDELFKKCSRESEVRYTGWKDRPRDERVYRFQVGLREGHTELAYIAHGTNLQLAFTPSPPGYSNEHCDFTKEPGKVHIQSGFIMNGVCVRWRGWIDLERLDGSGCLEFDDERAKIEDGNLRVQIERDNGRAYHAKRMCRDHIQGETDLSAHHIDVHRT